MFVRRRRFALLLIATITVGIGSATSIFSLVDVVLWKPLPYRDAERLFWIARTDESWRTSPVLASVWDNLGHAYPDYREWARTQRAFEATGAWFATTAVLATSEGVEKVNVARATASLAPLLGLRPALGRWFLPGEDDRGGPRVAVLSFEAWQARYGSDSGVVGKRLTLNAVPYDVVGVLPRGFRIAGDTTLVEFWTPAGIAPGDWQKNNFNYRVFGALRDGVTPTTATREALALLIGEAGGANTVNGANRASEAKAGVRLENLQLETTRTVRLPLVLLLASAVLLLAIACGNVASLLLGETAARDVEIATRASLGAKPGRVARQLLTENLLLACVGGACGGALAVMAVRVLAALAPSGIPRIESAHVDARGISFALVVTLVTAALFSAAPVGTLLRASPASILHGGSTRTSRRRGGIERGGVFVQCALVVVLLASAALLVRRHRRLLAVDPGFDAAHVLSVRLRFLPPVTRYRDAESRQTLLRELAEQVAAIPGVEAASFAFAVPFQSMSTTDINVAGSAVAAIDEEVAGTYSIVAPGYFQTMRIPLRAGRLFSAADDGPGTAVIVSEALARRCWPNASAIGQRIRVDDVWRDVVGVVGDVRHRSVDEDARSTFYLPAAQAGQRLTDALVVRTRGNPSEQLASIRRIVARTDPALAMERADRLIDLVDGTRATERFRMLLFSFFAATAVLLAAIGIVGVATNTAAARRKEFAIRMAVGAVPTSILRLVTRGTLAVAVAGTLVGVSLALVVSRVLRPFLYGISPADPATYLAVVGLVVAVAAVAAFVPARRATRMDLMRILSGD